MAGNTSAPGATVVSRALALLFAFDDRHPRLTLSQAAQRAGLPLPTAHRLVAELVAGGALVRRSDGDYVIGRRLWRVGLLAPAETGLREVATPFLNDLHAATRATLHLAVRDRYEVLYLERLSGRTSVPVVSTVGTRLPMHATGVGKVLLAHAPDDVVDVVMANLTRVTPYSVTQPGRLREQLAACRRDGWAATVEEMTLGACSVAVPVRAGADGPVVAALGIVVPSLKRGRGRLVTALQVAAQGISRSLD
jgi:DNA-binding IclR family transcriptional regulator